jgi:hypothetical protein
MAYRPEALPLRLHRFQGFRRTGGDGDPPASPGKTFSDGPADTTGRSADGNRMVS